MIFTIIYHPGDTDSDSDDDDSQAPDPPPIGGVEYGSDGRDEPQDTSESDSDDEDMPSDEENDDEY